MNLLWLIVVILIVFALLGSPSVGYFNHGYGWYPSSGAGLLILIIILILLFR
jgi:hypothetical protein